MDAVVVAVNMLILYLLGSYLLFNPVRDFLNKRKNMIKDTIEKANESQAEAEKLKAMYDGKIKNINKEADEIMSVANRKAKKREDEIIEAAKMEGASIIEHANIEAELEKQKVKDEVKREIVDVASAVAKKVVAANIDTSVQSNLVDETLKEIGDSTWRS